MPDSPRLVDSLRSRQPLLWLNPALRPAGEALARLSMGRAELANAEALLVRWAGALAVLFPELAAAGGLIESPLARMADPCTVLGFAPAGEVWLKQDHALPVAGSVKARGGIFEVLWLAEQVMRDAGIAWDTSHAPLGPEARRHFGQHTIAVGSTGNLGLAIGVMAAALGFRAQVHMASIAKAWKKQRLRERGVEVVEHDGDFAAAVAAGRQAAARSARHFFVDDERSETLFLGYAVAALRLRGQLAEAGIAVDAAHPLFVYLPCGVGGAPGGITFGLKQVFGDAVHCFFAEPCAAPAMLVRLAFADRPLSVHDFGLDNLTEADGLAVARASDLVHALTHELIAGVFTVPDDDLFRYLHRLHGAQGIEIEPSAAAGFGGPAWLAGGEGKRYLRHHGLDACMAQATHLLWTTGGLFVPPAEHARFRARGERRIPPYG